MPSSPAAVRRAGFDDLPAVRETRLRALADTPSAFASTLAREQALTDDDWRRRLGNGIWLLAWDGDEPVGIVSAFAEPGRPAERHLVSMWVAPSHRGLGVADHLVEAVVRWAREERAEALVLWVADGNDRARAFYDRVGFSPTGRRQPLPSDPDVGESQLSRPLSSGIRPDLVGRNESRSTREDDDGDR
ncbi:MAG TPA: GNAT family N-acetyltransferase [Acidimicrobiales bacterium]|nr:GNAT family N-acetyltransferase [Acidimicrobiales bacterium]